jgi:hypothetical protein
MTCSGTPLAGKPIGYRLDVNQVHARRPAPTGSGGAKSPSPGPAAAGLSARRDRSTAAEVVLHELAQHGAACQLPRPASPAAARDRQAAGLPPLRHERETAITQVSQCWLPGSFLGWRGRGKAAPERVRPPELKPSWRSQTNLLEHMGPTISVTCGCLWAPFSTMGARVAHAQAELERRVTTATRVHAVGRAHAALVRPVFISAWRQDLSLPGAKSGYGGLEVCVGGDRYRPVALAGQGGAAVRTADC